MTKEDHQYYLSIAEAISKKSTCLKRHYGAILVNPNGSIVSSGYNYIHENCIDDCISKNHCPRMNVRGKDYRECEAVHAEQHCLLYANREDFKDSILYIYGTEADGTITSGKPCHVCNRLIIASGIKSVIFYNDCNQLIEYRPQDLRHRYKHL